MDKNIPQKAHQLEVALLGLQVGLLKDQCHKFLLRYFIPEKYNFLAESYKIINLAVKMIQKWGQKRGHSLNCLKALCLLSFPLFLHQHRGNPVPTRKRHWGQENPCK